MKRTRRLPLAERRALYRDARIIPQQSWYKEKATQNARLATIMSLLLVTIEIGAIVLALLKIFGVINIDLLGFAGTAAAAIATWIQLK
jgi:SMODS and SLOG-associating 2TM effector domain 1